MENKIKKISLIVGSDTGPTRIDRWLKKKFTNIPVSLIHKFIRKKFIKLNDKKTTINNKIVTDDQITISQNWNNCDNKSLKKSVTNISDFRDNLLLILDSVIYKDDDIIVLNKPCGLAVQGGSKVVISIDDLAEGLKFTFDNKPKLVHRLDKDTSGILLLARTARAAQLLAASFKQKEIIKKYWAIVIGVPQKKSGIIKLPIAKKNILNSEKTSIDYDNGKVAISKYHVLQQHASDKLSWLEMLPITGRTHQLRVHAAAIGTPILGDGKYGRANAFINGYSNKLHLHAREITIPDFMGKTLHFTAELPTHMKHTFAQLEFTSKK